MRLVGARLTVGFTGTRAPAWLLARIRAGRVAGVILFGSNLTSRSQARMLVRSLQRARPAGDAPLLVMIDQEGGLVKRLAGAPSLSPAQLGRLGDAARARSEGLATARNLRGVGVNVDLAPVVDVARAGSSTERLQRSYGRDPQLVSRLAVAFAAGLRAGGVLATAKHFPGLGRAFVDEDLLANRIGASLGALRRVDEAPFAALAAAGVPLVMVSTGLYPALRPRPALISRLIATTELRRTGFRGVSITDDLEVPALRPWGSDATLAVSAVQAGMDLLLYGQGEASELRGERALVAALRSGRLARAAAEDVARRVRALRATLPPP